MLLKIPVRKILLKPLSETTTKCFFVDFTVEVLTSFRTNVRC